MFICNRFCSVRTHYFQIDFKTIYSSLYECVCVCVCKWYYISFSFCLYLFSASRWIFVGKCENNFRRNTYTRISLNFHCAFLHLKNLQGNYKNSIERFEQQFSAYRSWNWSNANRYLLEKPNESHSEHTLGILFLVNETLGGASFVFVSLFFFGNYL